VIDSIHPSLRLISTTTPVAGYGWFITGGGYPGGRAGIADDAGLAAQSARPALVSDRKKSAGAAE